MCGITGIVPNGEKDLDELDSIHRSMHAHQRNRGPDSGDIHWGGDNFVFGHQRLAIIDTSENASQPMETERWVLTYNGEIYNYQQLKKHLPDVEWKSGGDTEVLLLLIDRMGVQPTLDLLEGMFAFAAYDRKEDVLWMATDPMGIKPLYWYSDDRFFAFASSPGALTHCKEKWNINQKAVLDYMTLGATYQPLFDGMKKVMPGTVMFRHKSGKTGTNHYFTPYHYPDATQEDVLQAVKESIQSVKVADVPVGMFLSGGVDSTVVASQCRNLRAFHLESPEWKYAAEVAIKYDNELNDIMPGKFKAQECLEDYALQSGDCSAASIVPYIVSKEVAKFGKVAISANGADELFFGYDRMTEDAGTINQFNHIFRGSIAEGTAWEEIPLTSSRLLELESYVQFDLNKTLDFASMCHGLEVRVPYLNKCVVEMALSLPRKKHMKGRHTKTILKEFLIDEGFHESFVNRPKLGFSLFSEPEGYDDLKIAGCRFVNYKFGMYPNKFFTERDRNYFSAASAALLCWVNVWRPKLNL